VLGQLAVYGLEHLPRILLGCTTSLLLVRSQKLSWLSLQGMCDANANKPG